MRGLAAFAAAGVAFFALIAGAFAQEDLQKGKTGAQIFATDCALCHKTPQAAVKGGAPGEGFLRQHYTSSQQSAAAVAAYLRTIKVPANAERASKSKAGAKPAGKGEPKSAAKPKESQEANPAAEVKPANAPVKPGKPKASKKKEQPAEKTD